MSPTQILLAVSAFRVLSGIVIVRRLPPVWRGCLTRAFITLLGKSNDARERG